MYYNIGVFTYAACCGAPSTTCGVKTSPAGGIRQGDISSIACSPGETMVGCSVFSEDGHTAGAYIDGKAMHALWFQQNK